MIGGNFYLWYNPVMGSRSTVIKRDLGSVLRYVIIKKDRIKS